MRCQKCLDEGTKHRVEGSGGTTTLMVIPTGYWDEGDRWVQPEDPNTFTTRYQCSNGHSWTESVRMGVRTISKIRERGG